MISQLVYDEEDFQLILGLPVEKHLSGKHDQSTHGKGGSSGLSLRMVEGTKPRFREDSRTIYRGLRLTNGGEGEGDATMQSLAGQIKLSENKGYGKYWSSSADVAEQNSTGDHNLNYDWSGGTPPEPVYGVMLEMKLFRDASPISAEDSIFTFPSEKVMRAPSPSKFSSEVESVTAHYFRREPDGRRVYVGAEELPTDTLQKHLSGKHDQATHGRGAGSMVGIPATDKKSITPEQLLAVKRYTGSDFMDVNRSLRGEKIPSANPVRVKNVITNLDAAIDNSETKEAMILTRVVGATALVWSFGGDRIEALKKLVGKTITEKGFLSTSKKATISSTLGQLDKKEDVFLKIHTPKGTKALDISTVSFFSKEQEVIFPRDSKLTILSVKPSTTYAAIVEAEISN